MKRVCLLFLVLFPFSSLLAVPDSWMVFSQYQSQKELIVVHYSGLDDADLLTARAHMETYLNHIYKTREHFSYEYTYTKWSDVESRILGFWKM